MAKVSIPGHTCWLSLLAEDMDVHGGENVGVDLPAVVSRLFVAGVHRMRRPVGPEQRALIQRQRKGVRQLTSNDNLPTEQTNKNRI